MARGSRVGRWRELQRALHGAGVGSRGLVIGLDFDGTLSPIARRPHLARLSEPMRRLLVRLARSPDVRLAIISGRALPDIARQIGLRGAHYSGNHGLEIRGLRRTWRHPKALSAAGDIRALGRELASVAEAFPGVHVEDKRLSISIHYREMTPKHEAALRKFLARSLKPFAGSLELARGKKTWEVRPRTGWNKGHALLKIARGAGRAKRVLFVGDDRTDEEGFRTLGPKAITVKVGRSGKTSARFRLGRREEVRRLLELLVAISHEPA